MLGIHRFVVRVSAGIPRTGWTGEPASFNLVRYASASKIESKKEGCTMDWKLELVALPVSDVDRAKAFYAEKVGFHVDHDQRVSEGLRFVQLTPPGSACSIALGEGITDAAPGSVHGMQMVVADIHAAH